MDIRMSERLAHRGHRGEAAAVLLAALHIRRSRRMAARRRAHVNRCYGEAVRRGWGKPAAFDLADVYTRELDQRRRGEAWGYAVGNTVARRCL